MIDEGFKNVIRTHIELAAKLSIHQAITVYDNDNAKESIETITKIVEAYSNRYGDLLIERLEHYLEHKKLNQ